MSLFCIKCGTACPDNAVFCHNCGSSMQAQAAPQPSQHQAPQQPQYQAPQQPQYQAPQQPQYQAPQQPQYQAPQQPQYQAPQQPQYQAPQQPQYQAPQPNGYSAPSYNFSPTLSQTFSPTYVGSPERKTTICNFIVILVALFALVVGFINLAADYDIRFDVTASGMGMSHTATSEQLGEEMPTMAQFREELNSGNKNSIPEELSEVVDKLTLYVNSTYVLGIGSLLGGGILLIAAILSFASNPSAKSALQAGKVIFVLVTVVALILALIGGNPKIYQYGIEGTIKMSIHWTFWAAAGSSIFVAIFGSYSK